MRDEPATAAGFSCLPSPIDGRDLGNCCRYVARPAETSAMNSLMRAAWPLLGLALFVFTSACGPSAATKHSFSAEFGAARYQVAADVMGAPALCAGPPNSSHLLETLEAGAAYRAGGRRQESCKLFNDAEDYLKFYDQQLLAETSAQTLAALLVNDKALPYRGETYDGIMVNVYKALNYLEDAKWDQARVELNRVNERQRRAVERYSTAIKKQQDAVAKKKSESKNVPIEQTLENPALKSLIDAKYQDFSAKTATWSAYPDFVNPFATYVQGLSFLFMAEDAADYGKARDALRRVYGMTGNSRLVQGDLAMVESILDHKTIRKNAPPTVWMIFENGLGPVKEEVRIDIPLMFEKVSYVGIALPVLRFRDSAYSALQLRSGSNDIGMTEELFSMDGVVAKEFQMELPQVVTRAVLSAVLKTAVQYEATKEGGSLGNLLSTAYTFLSTGADTRGWSSLPKNIQIARFPRPNDGHVDILTSGAPGPLARVELPKSRYSIVYVKIPTPGAPATYQTIASKD